MELFNLKVIAHRGMPRATPENTLSSFKAARENGCGGIEFDVRLTKDNKLLIFHDDTLERTTNSEGRFFDYSQSYLRTLDAGTWFDASFSGERIPTLTETLSVFEKTKWLVNVELKAEVGYETELVKAVLDEMASYLISDKPTILFSSFSLKTLKILREYCKNCKIGFLLDEWQDDWQVSSDELNAVSVHLSKEITTKERVRAIKKTGRAVFVYTVDDNALAQKLIHEFGVDAIFSNIPDKISL